MRKRTIAGGTAAVVTIALAAGVGYAAVQPSSHSDSGYCADMSDATGLYDGNPVTQMGYKVGKVDHVESMGDHVQVTFTLDGGRKYPADVKAVTRSKSVLADRSLELVGNYRSGPQLAAGRCIALNDTATPKSISEITGSAADFINAVNPADGKQTLATAVSGLDNALKGHGTDAYSLMMHASAAASNPDQMIADFGSAITNMAPLTTETLENWATIHQILGQLPTIVTSATYDLWPGGTNLIKGIGLLVATLYDIQTNYGDIIWPAADQLADAIHLAATHSGDIKNLLSSVPSMAALLRQQAAGHNGLTVGYRQPTVRIDTPDGPRLCAALNGMLTGSCSAAGGNVRLADVGVLDLVLAKGK
ncbi:MCE family protein [Nocardia nova]|uniref:MlaD family protein n=1 Tax=Nocardia nova TaxID=37330 RepID=UPI0025AF1107|nr:MlaD family protein [Nocardia nova]MDN2495455.1 MCE family protein [Nocardia nova]